MRRRNLPAAFEDLCDLPDSLLGLMLLDALPSDDEEQARMPAPRGWVDRSILLPHGPRPVRWFRIFP